MMKTNIAVLVLGVVGWVPAAVAYGTGGAAWVDVRAGEIVVAQAWREKLDAAKRKGGQKADRPAGGQAEKEGDLPAGDCASYPIGCGPGYTNPKLRGIDCGGRSEIGCLCWKDLASKQQCDAYRAAKEHKK